MAGNSQHPEKVLTYSIKERRGLQPRHPQVRPGQGGFARQLTRSGTLSLVYAGKCRFESGALRLAANVRPRWSYMRAHLLRANKPCT